MASPQLHRPSAPPPPAAQWLAMAAAALGIGCLLAGTPAVAQAWWFPGILAALWMGMAAGFGRVARALLFPGISIEDPRRGPLSLGLGIAVALALDNLTGTAGMLVTGNKPAVIWTLVVGNAIAIGGYKPLITALDMRRVARAPLIWCALPAMAALAAAAAAPPGFLWSTEFGGYDALSYHLLLPKEWLEGGAIVPLEHNVYSAFPSFLEGAYLHLFALAGSGAPAHAGATAAQALHALLAVATAWMVGTLAAQACVGCSKDHVIDDAERRWARAIGWCGVLGVPWVLVTGSLAYNDLGVLAMLAAAMLGWTAAPLSGPVRLGIASGLLLGAAAGCKLTALLLAAIPFAAWAIFWPGGPGIFHAIVWCVPAAAGMAWLVLWPWMHRNGVATGSPTFPFVIPWLTPAEGTARNGWWSAEQIARFALAHRADPDLSWAQRLQALFDQGVRHGFGASPEGTPAASWLPQWSIAFPLGVAALPVMIWRQWRRGLAWGAMLGTQCAAWMLATHLQSRFLLPCLVPLTVVTAAAGAPWLARARAPAWRVAMAVALVLWTMAPAALLFLDARTNRNLQVWAQTDGATQVVAAGTRAAAQEAMDHRDPVPLAWAANHLLPADAVLGCEGEADLFWCVRTPQYGTVWDGGPLAQALRDQGNDIDGAIRALRERGITHLAIGGPMLDRWRAAGWIDPILTRDRVRAVEARLRPIAKLASGGTLYRLP
ncbi:MAG: hypothetical protein U0625_11125 [Phycisphaerales bacterium]